MEMFTADDFNLEEETKEASAENTEATEETKEVSSESEAETKAEEPAKEAADSKEGDSGAESPKEPEYTPNYSYKVKDKEHTFPEWMQGIVTDKEKEDYLIDLHTKALGIDSIKESRNRIETEYNDYQQSVQNEIFPVLDRVGEFDRANQVKDFAKAWEISSVNPEDIMDYLIMDEKLSEVLAKKMHDRILLEEQGPQAIASQRMAWTEQQRSKELEMQNTSMRARLDQMEENTFNQALDFTLGQKVDAVNSFDSINGEGAFRNFLNDFRMLSKQKGENLSPVELINGAINMLGLSATQPPASQGTQETINQQATVAPKEQKTPAAIPNVGTGANVSMVQKTANTWEEWEKSLNAI